MRKQKVYYYLLSMCLLFSGCDKCKDEVCADFPHAYFSFNLINAQTGEDLIFGNNPINHPDSIYIVWQALTPIQADKKNKVLGFHPTMDTFYIKFDREIQGNYWFDLVNLDTLHFEFQSLGMGECCEEYKTTKVYYNDSIYYPEPGVPVQLKKY